MHYIFRTSKQAFFFPNSSWYKRDKLKILIGVWTISQSLPQFSLKENRLRPSIIFLLTRRHTVILLKVIKNGNGETLTPNLKVYQWDCTNNSLASFQILLSSNERSRLLARKPNYRVNNLLDKAFKAKIKGPKLSSISFRQNSKS